MAQNFLIVGTQRTGSQALRNAIDQHPDIACGEEWLHHVAFHRKVRAAERVLSGDFRDLAHWSEQQDFIRQSFSRDTPWLGFKVLFRSSDKWLGHPRFAPALMLDRLEAYLRWLRGRPDIHVIQLVRRNAIEWLKSKYLSRATGLYTHARYPEGLKVEIPVARAVRALQAKRWVDARLASLASSNPYHRIHHEDFLANNRCELTACLSFLGCDPGRLPGDAVFVRPQSKGTAADYVRNYDDLLRALESRDLLASGLPS